MLAKTADKGAMSYLRIEMLSSNQLRNHHSTYYTEETLDYQPTQC